MGILGSILMMPLRRIQYIHEKGITHRDLRPEVRVSELWFTSLPPSDTENQFYQNVLLTKDDPPIVKVADFGLAKVVDSLTMLRVGLSRASFV